MITITKERLLTIKQWRETYGPDSNVVLPAEEAEELARIVLASLEAEPIGEVSEKRYGLIMDGTVDLGGKSTYRIIKGEKAMKLFPLGTKFYTAPPAPVSVPAAMEIDDDFDSAFEHGKAVGWNAYRAAMLQAEPVSNSDELPLDYLQGHKDGLEWAAQLAEANHPQTGDWLYDDQIDLARAIRKGPDMPTVQGGNSPVTPDAWISCSERMPDTKTAVLVAREFDRKGDWRMKWATYIPGHPDANDGWIIPGASWIPSHWMPLPEPPQEAK
ncbi:DUF551 domain-containing protein [Escherichia coli]|uniref:DUF551 domain-containing protein n=1 Tax=Escherichia coli TaxID=562 RepID=UPI0036FB2C23